MNTLELKQKIIDKIKSVDDVDLLKQIMNFLQPENPNEIKHLNENELEMVREIDKDLTFKNAFSEEQLTKEDSDWITEL
ncbi:hypothetical protein [Flavobacterium gilvum]|uniref:Uncharacterized protein n=1 Tax=Flavobacterium gilvum TaxID=1492737 RepID=A0AAC9I384_9FLAO|nr:hypothetical protein [Flavobacterium gilvum]AOW09436.1 hypothetical protein EM308_07930 [Flavobacterium gilvum]KFC59108.1 hypothetical protein FEM08_21220 [Flavobacterium gilvum]